MGGCSLIAGQVEHRMIVRPLWQMGSTSTIQPAVGTEVPRECPLFVDGEGKRVVRLLTVDGRAKRKKKKGCKAVPGSPKNPDVLGMLVKTGQAGTGSR